MQQKYTLLLFALSCYRCN